MIAVCYNWNFCLLGLRILSTTGFRHGNCFRYARLFSVLEYNFCPIHFSVNLIAMFVLEIRETRCRYAGATFEVSGLERDSKLCKSLPNPTTLCKIQEHLLFSHNFLSWHPSQTRYMPLFSSQLCKGNMLGFARHDWLIFVSALVVISQSKWCIIISMGTVPPINFCGKGMFKNLWYFFFVSFTPAGVWLLFNGVLALLLSLFYNTCGFDRFLHHGWANFH